MMCKRQQTDLIMWLILSSIGLLASASWPVAPENVAIIPKLGELGDPDEAFLSELDRGPEHCFADPWVELGEDWLLKPCFGAAWSLKDEHRWIALNEILESDLAVKTMIADEELTVQRISAHLVRLPGRSQWWDLLASPYTISTNGRREPLASSYEIVHWIRNQHAFLSRTADTAGPEGILVSVYGSRREAMDALITGEIDALDDLSAAERKRIHRAQANVNVLNRRSNELLYLLWNSEHQDLVQLSTRNHLERLMDKRRIASRAGSRAAWATSCPVPAPVPGAWSWNFQDEFDEQTDVAVPESLVIWSEDTEAAISAGIEVSRDMEQHNIRVHRFVARAGEDPRCEDSGVWSAWIGSYHVSPECLLPPIPGDCPDPLAACRAVGSLRQMPTMTAWIALTDSLRSTLNTQRAVTFLCWLPRWGAVSRRWLIPEPRAFSILNDVTDWLPVPHARRP